MQDVNTHLHRSWFCVIGQFNIIPNDLRKVHLAELKKKVQIKLYIGLHVKHVAYLFDSRGNVIARSFDGNILIAVKIDPRGCRDPAKELSLEALIAIQWNRPIFGSVSAAAAASTTPAAVAFITGSAASAASAAACAAAAATPPPAIIRVAGSGWRFLPAGILTTTASIGTVTVGG
jgi:hypothetical protein